jgi:anti-sigma28 factor (negative regulator of flagellin synthesis)
MKISPIIATYKAGYQEPQRGTKSFAEKGSVLQDKVSISSEAREFAKILEEAKEKQTSEPPKASLAYVNVPQINKRVTPWGAEFCPVIEKEEKTERIEAIRDKIEKGTYQIDTEKLVEAIFSVPPRIYPTSTRGDE